MRVRDERGRNDRSLGRVLLLPMCICILAGILLGLGVVWGYNQAFGVTVGASGDTGFLQSRIPHLTRHTYAHLSETPDVSARYLTLEPDDSWTWAEIAVGDHDNALRQWSAALGSVGHRMVTFSHEPSTGQHEFYGEPRDFRKAWRHVHDLLDSPNVTWVWNTTWSSMDSATPVERRYPENWWPGRGVVDVVSAEVFNWDGCKGGATTFSEKADEVKAWADYWGKPVLFAEVGSNTHRVSFLNDAHRWVDAHADDVAGFFYFQTTHPEHGCEWRLTTDREVAALGRIVS